MRARLLALMLLAVPLAGCGDTAEQVAAPVLPTAPRHHVPTVAKKKLVKRAERLCRLSQRNTEWTHPPANGDIRAALAFARRVVVASRRGYRVFHALGIPPRGLARKRWQGFLSQYRAVIEHLDELQAGVEYLDGAYAHDSWRQFWKAYRSAVRRGHKLGLSACVS
jgi:hypothetical protein